MSEKVLLVLITVVTALSASFGGIILSQRHERRKLYREKLETIIELLYEDQDWLESRQNFYVFGDLRRSLSEFDNKEPYDRASALVSLYFLEDFRDEIIAVNVTRAARKRWQHDQYEQKQKDQDAWLADKDKNLASHKEVHEAYLTALTMFEIKARQVMKRELERSMPRDVWSWIKARVKWW
jgi:hypothetical protein